MNHKPRMWTGRLLMNVCSGFKVLVLRVKHCQAFLQEMLTEHIKVFPDVEISGEAALALMEARCGS